MSDQPPKKNVAITIGRERPFPPKIVVTTGFKLRIDKSSGLIDVLLEASGQKGERIILDPVVLLNNSEHLKRFAASVAIDPDETSQKEDVSVSEQINFSNIIHLSRIANRGETMFCVFSLADWVNESRQSTRKNGEIKSYDVVVSVSTAALQKKMVLELVLLINQLGKTE